MQSDLRKWFMKQHDKGNGATSKSEKPALASEKPLPVNASQTEKSGDQAGATRRKTSKYFNKDQQKTTPEKEKEQLPTPKKIKRGGDNLREEVKPSPPKKAHVVKDDDDDDDFVVKRPGKKPVDATNKRFKDNTAKAVSLRTEDVDESDDDNKPSAKSAGRGRGGRGAASAPAGGRGRGGGGRGGFMNFGDRKDPPNKGTKEVPEGVADCLAGLTFVISGTLDSLEREEAEDLIKRHGGRVTGSVSKKTSYLLCDEDIEGRKSAKAKELGTPFLTEDGLFDKIRASNKSRTPARDDSKKTPDKLSSAVPKRSPQKTDQKKSQVVDADVKSSAKQASKSSASLLKPNVQGGQVASVTWTDKYRPKTPTDMVGNQTIFKQLHDWLSQWDDRFLHSKGKGKKSNDSGAKKAVLLSGTPGIGKTTSAKLVSKMLGFEAVEVNASDSRGKANSNIVKGIGGSTANSIKELIGNESLNVGGERSKHLKTVLIMDEVDGMSAGDRGGVADLIASIKISKIPIICICNDRYSQKLKSLVNYCLPLNFRKPTKQQMAKRLMQIANAEKLQVNEIALEELAERSNGDIRMAINQLQYMSLSMSVIKYEDIRNRLQSSSKDEDISPFTAVDKLFGYNGGKLRMDERINLSMSDMDLVPLLIQENYVNYKPSGVGKDENGLKRMNLLARAAESIGNGDIYNVQIRRYRQWQLSQSSAVSSSIIPAALLHGSRETLEQGERNFNRFGGWLGKNSTMGKNYRLLEDLHVHVLASRESNLGRGTLRLDYLTLLLKQLTEPLRSLPKDEAVKKVVEFMDLYSINQEDFDTIVELSKFKGYPNPLDGIQPAVKSALTKAYKEGSRSRVVKVADLITLPGIKKAPKKRIAAILEPATEELAEDNAGLGAESEDEATSETEDTEEGADGGEKLKVNLESNHAKGVQVQVELKGTGNSSAKRAPRGRGKGGSEAKKTGQGSAKRKR
ncbi:hypothetical protein V2J09_012065 [Rumex salicifolius]